MEFTVSVTHTFGDPDDPTDVSSPEAAVEAMVEWLQTNAAYTGYKVTWTDDDGETHSVFVDADDL